MSGKLVVNDHEWLILQEINYKLIQWEAWQAKNNQWSANILAKRNGVPFDTEALWEEMRAATPSPRRGRRRGIWRLVTGDW